MNICTRIGTSINMYISMGVNIANKTTTISNRRVIHMHTRISVAIHASISISLLLKLIPIFASLVTGSITMRVHIREPVKVFVFIQCWN